MASNNSSSSSYNREALDTAWAAVWNEFLHNKISMAAKRAEPWLSLLPSALSDDIPNSDLLVTLADMAHIYGAANSDDTMLRSSLAAYEAHLHVVPDNRAGARMRMETLLRLREYERAFAACDQLLAMALTAEDPELEIAPFQLIHDAECVEHAIKLGADSQHGRLASSWRELASLLRNQSGEERVLIRSLPPSQKRLLGDNRRRTLPMPPAAIKYSPTQRALRADIDWTDAQEQYITHRMVIIDDILDASTLRVLQAYMQHGAHFRTMRRGFLGCFPGDGLSHPLLLRLANELVSSAPRIFANYALALWWLFKYSETNTSGIGIHADPAAVNINLWLTPDEACLEGGGLTVYSHVPDLHQTMQQVNHEFADGEEATLREQLKASGAVHHIQYKCNRAAIFVSDQYHESMPFRFASGYENRRCNLTLLFGDRWSTETHDSATKQDAVQADKKTADLWSLFD